MNNVNIVGRITKDFDLLGDKVKYVRITIAVDSLMVRDKTNFIPVTIFGQQAEFAKNFLGKGRLVSITGELVTNSYQKDGNWVNSFSVNANRIKSLEKGVEVREQSPKQDNQVEAIKPVETKRDVPWDIDL